MKKIITLVLALALVLTSVVAIAETVEAPAAPKGTPNINSFATMKTKYNEKAGVITITLSKPVDRLLIKWAEKGAEPEELAVGEDLTATALTWGHKYMPGTTQYYATWEGEGVDVLTETLKDITTSERAYVVTGSSVVGWGPVMVVKGAQAPVRELKWDKDDAVIDAQIAAYKEMYEGYDFEVKLPTEDEAGYITGTLAYDEEDYTKVVNHNFSTVIATAGDVAFMTVQGEWAVYYNRAGKIVGIEYFEGQF